MTTMNPSLVFQVQLLRNEDFITDEARGSLNCQSELMALTCGVTGEPFGTAQKAITIATVKPKIMSLATI